MTDREKLIEGALEDARAMFGHLAELVANQATLCNRALAALDAPEPAEEPETEEEGQSSLSWSEAYDALLREIREKDAEIERLRKEWDEARKCQAAFRTAMIEAQDKEDTLAARVKELESRCADTALIAGALSDMPGKYHIEQAQIVSRTLLQSAVTRG